MVPVHWAGRCAVAVLTLLAAAAPRSSVLAADLVELVKQVEHAVVRVETDKALGSGVIVDDRGFVFTNYHVIDGATRVTVVLRSGELLRAEGFLGVDPSRDLALLKTGKLAKPQAIKIAAAAPQVGESVAAFGNPQGFSFTTSEGIVSSVRTGKDVSATIGAEVYRAAGYSDNATWVQTTAAISGGNSGGPLVNMNAEVIGLNTWHYPGQNLNFAISAADMRRVLGTADPNNVNNFVALPRRAKPLDPSPGSTQQESFSVELPTGRIFTFGIFETPDNPMLLKVKDASGVAVLRHPNGAMYAAASQKKGVLHGLTIAQYDNKEPMVYAQYVDGRLHGNLKTWDEAGRPVLFAQYIKGRRNGFLCLFDDEQLAMLIQYKYDEPEWIQLMSDEKVLEGFPSRQKAAKNPHAKKLLARLDDVDKSLEQNEVEFRKQVAELERERRKAVARKLGPEKRRRIQQRVNQRAAADAAFLQQLRRRAYGR